MRVLTYIFVGAGAAVAIIALAVTLFDNGDQATIEPQSDAPQAEIAQPQSGAADAAGTVPPASALGAISAAVNKDAPATANANADSNALSVTIDLAQVRPDGNAVFAGKATPHAEVTVFEGDVVLGRTKADENGEWVIIPEAALGAGEHLVSVGAVSEDGTSSVADITMAIKVGETSEDRPLVALLPQTETDMPKLLQSPDDRPATPVDLAKSGSGAAQAEGSAALVPSIAPRSLSWKAAGELVVAGVSRGGARVDAVADGQPFGAGETLQDGGWQIAGKVDMTRSGRVMQFTLRDANDAVVATYELPVATRDLSQGLDGSRMVIVQRGDALWRIAYSSYGEGIRYVDIVRRNASAIDNPDLIFPNQIFALPQKP